MIEIVLTIAIEITVVHAMTLKTTTTEAVVGAVTTIEETAIGTGIMTVAEKGKEISEVDETVVVAEVETMDAVNRTTVTGTETLVEGDTTKMIEHINQEAVPEETEVETMFMVEMMQVHMEEIAEMVEEVMAVDTVVTGAVTVVIMIL